MLKLSIERTDAVVPPPAWTLNPRSEIWRDIQGEICAYAEILGDEYWMHLPGLASFRFSCCGEEIAAAVTSGAREEVVRDAYHRRVLPMALQVCGREVLHASAVRSPAGVTLLCGVSESGKSTIAYGLGLRGYTLWADDMVAWQMSHRGGQALSLPFNVRLRPSSAALFDSARSQVLTPEDGDGIPGDRKAAPLASVCVLRRARADAPPVTVRRLSLSEGFTAALDHSCCFLPQNEERKRRMIRSYLDLAAGVPIFDVCFRSGLENLPAILDVIEQLLQGNCEVPLTVPGTTSEPCTDS